MFKHADSISNLFMAQPPSRLLGLAQVQPLAQMLVVGPHPGKYFLEGPLQITL
jgi:hypothetical protein